MTVQNNLTSRQKIKYRIRKRVKGSAERPRLVVFRSLNNIYAQIVDDVTGKTICSVSNISKDVKNAAEGKITKLNKSKLVGKKIAEKANELKIKKVEFDR